MGCRTASFMDHVSAPLHVNEKLDRDHLWITLYTITDENSNIAQGFSETLYRNIFDKVHPIVMLGYEFL